MPRLEGRYDETFFLPVSTVLKALNTAYQKHLVPKIYFVQKVFQTESHFLIYQQDFYLQPSIGDSVIVTSLKY